VTRSPITLRSDDGPDDPPASARRAGFGVGRRATRFRVARGDAGTHRTTLRELDLVIGPDDELRWYVFPAFDAGGGGDGAHEWQHRGFASTGVDVDLRLEDGSLLSERRLPDRNGFAPTAIARGRSKAFSPDQWNSVRVDLATLAGQRVMAIELELEGAASALVEGWVEVEIVQREGAVRRHPSDWVLTTRGTHSSGSLSRGNTVPATALPNAFSLLTPVTDAGNGSWMYNYHRDNDEQNRPTLQAIAIAHTPTPWLGDYGVLQLMPVPDLRPIGEPRAFERSAEIARAHEYAVTLLDGTVIRLAPTAHGGAASVTFATDNGCVAIDQLTDDGALVFELTGAHPRVSGYSDYRGEYTGESTRVYFVVEFDAPAIESHSFDDGPRPHVSGAIRFDLAAGAPLTARIATSLVGLKQARHALELETPRGDSVAVLAERARAQWDALLGRVEVDGATDDQLTTLYSCLYRLFLYPGVAAENRGTTDEPDPVYASIFSPAPRAHTPTETGREVRHGTLAVGNGFWDTYRTTWPAYSLLAPDRAATLLDGFVQHYRDGGWMSRWSSPGYTDLMVGTSSDVVLADAVVKGVTLPDAQDAYDSALRNATVPSDDPRVGRKGLARGIFRGYISRSTPEGLSWAIENAINDFGIARLSQWMLANSDPDDPRRAEYASNVAYFASRAAGYAELFDPETGFFRGRDDDGAFDPEPFDPEQWGGDYTETNAWGMAFSVPHDGAGLAALHGGEDGLRSALDAYFSTPESGSAEGAYGRVIHEMVEARNVRMGMFAISNQPAHHVPFQYLFAGAPHRTQDITREAVERLFLGSEIGQGYPGDEDNGEMSAWYLFAALGLYPLTVADPSYVLTSPLHRAAKVDLGGGRMLRIEAPAASRANRYIQSVRIDGVDWPRPWVSHATIARGCTIEFDLGPEPSQWGAEHRPPSLSDGGVAPLVDVTGSGSLSSSHPSPAGLLTDDDSATWAELPEGFELEWRLAEPATVRLYTVTAAVDPRAVPARWSVEGLVDGQWTVLAAEEATGFRWPRQTRAFSVPLPRPCGRYRMRISAGSLAQVELLA
jgi:predicted alpha-1,2-mannosidase